MPDRPRSNLSVDLRTSNLRALRGPLCQAADLVILSGVFLGIVLLPAFHREGANLATFLQWRVSLRDILVAAMCVATWRMILISVWLYGKSAPPSLIGYVLRCVVALNSCTVVVGMIEAVLKTRSDIWRLLGVYWIVCLLCMTAVRVVLIGFDRRAHRSA